MEPIKINVEVSLSTDTLDVLKRIAAAITFAKLNNEGVKDVVAQVDKEEPVVEDMPEFTQEEIKKAEEAVKEMEPAKEEVKAETEAPKKEITDEELMAKTKDVVAKLKAAGKSSTIVRTKVFSKFGIASSTGCPKEKREELVKELEALV